MQMKKVTEAKSPSKKSNVDHVARNMQDLDKIKKKVVVRPDSAANFQSRKTVNIQ